MARSRLRRGDLVIAAFPGDYGKPRPTVVIQSDRLEHLESILLCPLTSDTDTHGPARVHVAATQDNGLKADSLVMADKVTALSLSRCRERIGALNPEQIDKLNEALALVIGLAD